MPRKRKSDTTQVKVRIRGELRKRLEREARKSGTPLNSEITARLVSSFGRDRSAELVDLLLGNGRAADDVRLLCRVAQIPGGDLFEMIDAAIKTAVKDFLAKGTATEQAIAAIEEALELSDETAADDAA